MDERDFEIKMAQIKQRIINLQWEYTGLMLTIADIPNHQELIDHADWILDEVEGLVNANWPSHPYTNQKAKNLNQDRDKWYAKE